MASLRAARTSRRKSPDCDAPGRSRRIHSHSGSTILFDTMVDSAIAATITIDVAEEKPPRNDSIASASRPSDRGRVSTNRSGFDPAGSARSPITAIGTTKRLISSRYSGNAQEAVDNCRSLAFSTTST